MKDVLKVLIILLISTSVYSQVGIGTTTPSDAAMLEIAAQTSSGEFKGFLPPRVSTNVDRDAINPQASDVGLLVFVTATGCLNIWNGFSWEDIHCTTTLGSFTVNNQVWINEFHYSNNGPDVDEFVEIAGTAGLDITGFKIVLYDGVDGTEYESATFTGMIGDDTGEGFGFATVSPSRITNGNPDGLALIDSAGLVIQFLSYGGSFTASDGNANGLASSDIGIVQTGSASLDPVGASLQLSGSGSQAGEFNWTRTQVNTANSINTGQDFN